MSNRISRQAIGSTVAFSRDGERPLCVRVRHVQVREAGGGGQRVELSLELDPASWARVDTEHWFGVSAESVHPSCRGHSVQAAAPVRLEIRLRDAALPPLSPGADVDEAAAAVGEALRKGSASLAREDRWLWLSVLQERPGGAPGFLKGFFSLSHG